MFYILLAIIGIIALLILVCIVRALAMKPTAAINAVIDTTPEERDETYGKILSEMIQCETISDRFNFDVEKFYRFHKVLEKLFPQVHEHCEKIEIDGNLLFKWQGSSNENPILLMSHQDVVEAGGTWEHDPFGGEVIDGAVWGRGTVDTKGNLFCILQSVEELIKTNYQPACDIYIASSCTEEIAGGGAEKTVAYLKSQGIHLAMMLDEGGMIMEEPIPGLKGTYGVVGVLEKGTGNVRFTARSNGGHASAPPKNSPLVRLGSFITELEKNDPFYPQLNPTVEEMFKRFAPNMSFSMKLLFANLWLTKPLVEKVLPSVSRLAGAMIKTTLAFTMAQGSNGLNVIPQEAFITGNMRFIHHQGIDDCLKILKERAAKYDIEVETIYATPPCPVVDFKGKPFLLIEEIMGEIYPDVGVSPYAMTGGTDSRQYTGICDNCIRFAPLYINKKQFAGIHGLNEHIDTASLRKGVDFYKVLIQKMESTSF